MPSDSILGTPVLDVGYMEWNRAGGVRQFWFTAGVKGARSLERNSEVARLVR
jgi:hypothetical protein